VNERTRRRRRRATAPQGPPPAAPKPQPPSAEPAPAAPKPEPPSSAKRRPREASGERGLRDLVGAGRSQVGVSGALRARDVNRPTDDDLAEAERDLVIVRRHWKPPADG